MWNARLDEAQAGLKMARKNINNLRYTDDTTLMAESKEELKSLLMKVKEESEKAGLKFNIQKTNVMASCPITSNRWGNNENSDTWLSWAPKPLLMVTLAMKEKDACSWKKSYDQPTQHIKKQRCYFADKGPSSQGYGFSSSHTYGCESCTLKKAECCRIDAFELWCWRRFPGEGKGYPLQYSGLENSMDRIAWQVIVHGVTKNWTHLSDFHCHSSKEQAPFNLVAAVTIYSDFWSWGK